MIDGVERSIAEYILKHYSGPVVEVGIGRYTAVAEHINRSGILVQTTDIIDENEMPDAPNYVKDDILSPDIKIYEGASLIYSIRAPEELQTPIARVVSIVGADLILKSLGSEIVDISKYLKRFEVVNLGGTAIICYRK